MLSNRPSTAAPSSSVGSVDWVDKVIQEYDQNKQFGELLQKVKEDVVQNPNNFAQNVLALAHHFAEKNKFGFARRIFAIVDQELENTSGDLKKAIFQAYALYTSKDPELISDLKLDNALQILGRAGEKLNQTADPETLEVAGTIYFRKWELTGRMNELERAFWYCRRGYDQGKGLGKYSNGINAAFILDLLAALEESEATQAGKKDSPCAQCRRREADGIRAEIIPLLSAYLRRQRHNTTQDSFWFRVTLAEAYFGSGNYPDGCSLLKAALDLANKANGKWKIQSTLRQFARLAELQDQKPGGQNGKATLALISCIAEVFPGMQDVIQTSLAGKVGLALSGGGLRASLFHLGVLAKLAELDLLRHVEVISCVSGGSIIGALYYLQLGRKLMHGGKKSPDFYLDLVNTVKNRFLQVVQKNIRTRVFENLWKNFRMILPSYSRTDRLAELLERELYCDPSASQTTCLSSLDIQPDPEKSDFSPREDNWQRRDKVPILVLNAAALNTGHNWQFGAHWMGESPAGITSAIDKNARLRRLYYAEAPHLPQVGLGQAVAASAAVPVIFKPLELKNLYRKRAANPGPQGTVDEDLAVQLVDGGVYDNQGIASLLVEDCNFILISDGSGQMDTQLKPSGKFWSVLWRANSILQKRVREAQYRELLGLRRASILRGFAYVHLTKDLDVDTIDWRDYQGPQEPESAGPCLQEPANSSTTCYDMGKEIQKKLAAIRTDLDSFCDQEAYALMASGYKQTEYELDKLNRFKAFHPQKPITTKKTDILDKFKTACDSNNLHSLLDVARHNGFKVWRLGLRSLGNWIPARVKEMFAFFFRSVKGLGLTLLFLGLINLVSGVVVGLVSLWYLWPLPLPDVTVPLYWIGMVSSGLILYCVLFPLHFPVIAWIAAWIHLWCIDPWYLEKGKIE
jgi:predicted acylesterase/phospholipase RssA